MIERIFKAYDIRATCPEPLNEDAAWKVGYSTALYLQRSRQSGFGAKVAQEKTIVVGRDARTHSPGLAGALIEGIRAAETNVVDLGMVDAPMIYFAVNHLDCVAGVHVTGSHNPENYSGFKISGPKAKAIGAATGLEDIRRIAGTLRVGRTGQTATLEQMDLWAPYRKHVLQFLNLARKMRVVVDASNGMAGWMIPAIFDGIPDLEIIPLLFETEGTFVHDPNPAVDANLQMLREKVTEQKADLGVCFDGDADRCGFVTEQAQSIRPDLVAAIIARDVLGSSAGKGALIIHDVRCSRALDEEIRAAGGESKRERVGAGSIRRTMADSGAAFGCEMTGHYYFRENFCADSGAIAFARLLSILSSQSAPFSELAKPLAKYVQSGELSFFSEDVKDVRIRDLADKYRKYKVDYVDGLTVDGGEWWFNVRKSNTEPLLRLNIECKDDQMLQEKLQELKGWLGENVPTR